ncbi:MAG: DUF937 domain-containing protein [Chloroflexales bacterium]|nr:DUF937 domain-containing protein [Chloroflexales bacterium]
MASILETISNVVTPDMISGIGKKLGMSDEVTRQGMALANALITGGLARAASTDQGAAKVAELVEQADSSVLGNLSSVVTSALSGSTATTEQLFGNNFDLVTSSVKKATGIEIRPLLAMGAPVVLGVVKNMAGQQKLDPAGIAKLLQTEVKGLSRRDGPTAKSLKELLKPLEAQDKVRARFTDAEWADLQAAPVNAGALIMLADPSGGGGLGKEIDALQVAVGKAVASSAPTDLVNILFRDGIPTSVVDDLVKSYQKTDGLIMREALLTPVSAAMAAVRAKGVKGEAEAFQSLLTATLQQVASAAKEGGFLGIGGTNVSDAEKEALDAVSAALAVGAS